MAPPKRSCSVSDASVCNSCKKPTSSDLKCELCETSYHPACAVRVKGLKIVGFNIFRCPGCVEPNVADTLNEHEQLKKSHVLLEHTNNTLNQVILKLMESQDSLNEELIKINRRLNVLTSEISVDRYTDCPISISTEANATVNKHTNTFEQNGTSINIVRKRQNSNTSTGQTFNNVPHLGYPNAVLTEPNFSSSINNNNVANAHQNNKISDSTLGANEPERASSNDWKTFLRKKRQQRQAGTNMDSGDFVSNKSNAKKKIWLFLSRVKPTITDDVIKSYIANKTKSDVNIEVKQCKVKKENATSNYFMVGVEPELKDLVYDQAFWPRGIMYQRFDFSLGRNFLAPHQALQTQT